MKEPGFETLCAHFGDDPDRFLGAPVPPIFQNSLFTSPDTEAFLRRGDRRPSGYDYTRVANPTTEVFEQKLAALEKTDLARCFGSGMAAVCAAVLSRVRAGDHVVAVESAYGPTRSFLSDYLARFQIGVTYVPGDDPEQFAAAARPETRLYYLESPSSLVMRLQDVEAVVTLARERNIATVLDNSWATPYFQNPVEFGVDLVVHSATKYLGGHSDVVAGVVMGPEKHMRLLIAQEGVLLGSILDPFAAWLLLRGVRTLGVRMDRHQQSGLAVARFLEAHPKVACVAYPGLESHPQYALARRQMRGCSGLLSFALKDGGFSAARDFVDRLRYFGIAVSWGGFESLAIPLTFPPDAAGQVLAGARISVGLETVEDLLEDLAQALE